MKTPKEWTELLRHCQSDDSMQLVVQSILADGMRRAAKIAMDHDKTFLANEITTKADDVEGHCRG
jgi:hypothetical protein